MDRVRVFLESSLREDMREKRKRALYLGFKKLSRRNSFQPFCNAMFRVVFTFFAKITYAYMNICLWFEYFYILYYNMIATKGVKMFFKALKRSSIYSLYIEEAPIFFRNFREEA